MRKEKLMSEEPVRVGESECESPDKYIEKEDEEEERNEE